MKRWLSYVALVLLVGVVLVSILTLLGGQVSTTFSQINSGFVRDAGCCARPPAAPHEAPGIVMVPTVIVPEAAVLPTVTSPERAQNVERTNERTQPSNLSAGQIDDNADFKAYLQYVDSSLSASWYQRAWLPYTSERYIIKVLDDNQRPVLDAHVQIYNGQEQVFTGRTYADGRTMFQPELPEPQSGLGKFRVVVEQGNLRSERLLQRGAHDPIEVVLHAAAPPSETRLDILFLLDTTGSMDDELAEIQTTIDSIAERIHALEARPRLRFGLVAYRDHGDNYVTKTYDFTDDLGRFRALLGGLRAAGGGDTPEALNEALFQAIHEVYWSDSAIRLVFLVGDAPPHAGEQETYNHLTEAIQAVARGVKIYPIAASGTDEQAEFVFRHLAQVTMARFIFLTYQPGQNGGAPGASTTLRAGEHQDYAVGRLDDVVVDVVRRELAAAQGAE